MIHCGMEPDLGFDMRGDALQLTALFTLQTAV